MIIPSSDRMTPLPCPNFSKVSISMRTTEGPTASTTAVTKDVFLRGAAGAGGEGMP
jgi:hypothetical protein